MASYRQRQLSGAAAEFSQFANRCVAINDAYIAKHDELVRVFAGFRMLHHHFNRIRTEVDANQRAMLHMINTALPEIDPRGLEALQQQQTVCLSPPSPPILTPSSPARLPIPRAGDGHRSRHLPCRRRRRPRQSAVQKSRLASVSSPPSRAVL